MPQPDAPDAPDTPSRRTTPPLKRVLLAAGAAAVVGGGLLGMAMALDKEPTEVAVQRAPLQVGPGATTPGPQQSPAPAAELPPLSLSLDQPPPDGIADLDAAQQVVRLRELTAAPGAPARRYVELGRAQMSLGDTTSAEQAFREALKRAPGDTAATMGMTFLDFLSGKAGEKRAVAAMAKMARERPRDQLVLFNQGMLSVYARDPNAVVKAWQRTVEINPRSRLGMAARMLLERLTQARG